jgi:hypothetical protein
MADPPRLHKNSVPKGLSDEDGLFQGVGEARMVFKMRALIENEASNTRLNALSQGETKTSGIRS